MDVHYGDGPSQFGTLHVPAGSSPRRIVVLIHGGFWRDDYGLDLMEPLADDLNARGFATWNVEYRRVGERDGGYPGTLVDVASAMDELADLADANRLDLSKLTVVGHSSGGHLALWAAGRKSLPVGSPGAAPRIVPNVAIGLGPVLDLRGADAEFLGGDAVAGFIGGHVDAFPERYAVATPSPGTGVDVIVVRGADDDIVPSRFSTPTPVGGVTVIDVPGDHFALIDPASEAWQAVISRLR